MSEYQYYDAHFYIANWGTVRPGLAFPKGAITLETIQPYLRGGEPYEETLTVKEIGNRCVVWWERNEEGGWGWTEGEGLIDPLIGVREELMRGDYRALLSRHYNYGRDKMLALARRTATSDQRKALAQVERA